MRKWVPLAKIRCHRDRKYGLVIVQLHTPLLIHALSQSLSTLPASHSPVINPTPFTCLWSLINPLYRSCLSNTHCQMVLCHLMPDFILDWFPVTDPACLWSTWLSVNSPAFRLWLGTILPAISAALTETLLWDFALTLDLFWVHITYIGLYFLSLH